MLGDYAWCQVENACLAHCTDYVNHATDIPRFEAELDAWLKEFMTEAERQASREAAADYRARVLADAEMRELGGGGETGAETFEVLN